MPKPNSTSPPLVFFQIGMLPISVWSDSRSVLRELESAARKGQILPGVTRELVVRGCRHASWNSKSGRVVQRARSILRMLGVAESGDPAAQVSMSSEAPAAAARQAAQLARSIMAW
jgi:hypothetical protein